ncbi:MAG: IS3 family transposase [Faecalimonas umbilicata]|uniref:IS3 family transposase n=1 Tax=Faecalimonas umbilicata TaxID=1912855 RepID=UPI00399F7F42
MSKEYKRVVANMQCSYSKKPYPWDNACIESFHSRIERLRSTRIPIQNYGAPKITAELRKSGEYVSEKTVGNYMRQMGIKAHWVKPYIQTTIDYDFSQKLKNILNEEFNPAHPDAVWCSDITYICIFEGFVYLTSVMDLYSRKIISWVLSETYGGIPRSGMC